ncbi:MAG TPA: hypothetical protein VI997_07290 [Candidatus Thermoplasmatota archaeon]|nr:hypothetical protein [Candidatus Thermoplasmatota archaeon]
MPDTTIRVPASTRDRLRKYGAKGKSYGDILEELMDQVDYRKFLREQLDLLDEATATKDKLVALRDG